MSRKIKILLLLTILTLSSVSTFSSNCIIEDDEYINEVLKPTKDYNIIIKNDTSNCVESYRYEMLDGSGCYDFNLKEGKVDSYTKDYDYTNLGSIIYVNDKCNYLINDYENRFSYVTLFTNIQGLSQTMTGANWDYNCVPTAVMAAYLWSTDQSIDGYKERIKNLIQEVPYTGRNGRGYTSDTVYTLLDQLCIDYKIDHTYSRLVKHLNEGNVCLCAIDSRSLPLSSCKDSLIGKDYDGGGGHEVLVTGYLNIYNEATDSYQLYIQYLDSGEYFNANRRFAPYSEFLRALNDIHGDYLIVQKNQSDKSVNFIEDIQNIDPML